MKKKSSSTSGLSQSRLVLSLVLCSLGTVLAAISFAPSPGPTATASAPTTSGVASKAARVLPRLGGEPPGLRWGVRRVRCARAGQDQSLPLSARVPYAAGDPDRQVPVGQGAVPD